MKRLAAAVLFAALCCFLSLPATHADTAAPIGIDSPEALAAIADDPRGSYVLTADIDMKGVDWKPLSFYGAFDGGGHTIYNLTVTQPGDEHATTVDGNNKRYDTVFAGLFSVVRDATIKDLRLLNVNVRISTGENCFAAGLAGFAEDTAISGCSVQGRGYLYNTNWMCGLGGVVGFGRGTISGCSADVELVFVDGDLDLKCEEFIGAMLATGYADIEGCDVRLRAYASVQGYCHNGGIVGMYFVYDRDYKASHRGYVRGCTSDTSIWFYENNRNRRAYCKAYVGEKLNRYVKITNNKTLHFLNGETKDYSKYLLPEKDAEPAYTAAVTAPTCTEFGYTTYTCAKCGYAYADDYVAPAHTPGEWAAIVEPTRTEPGLERLCCAVCGELIEEREVPIHAAGDWMVARAPTYTDTGLRQLLCKDCGKVLEEEEMPKLIPVSSCKLDRAELKLNYKDSARLSAEILPADASDTGLVWTSSDESVATVDGQGNVYAAGRGEAVVTCASADGNASSACMVAVSYTAWQWIVVYILFGWLWY